jgi:hypothetical protein
MSKFRSGLTIIGFASWSLSTLGCAMHTAENRRLVDELGRAERSASDNRRHIAELEWRLRELEAQRDAESRRGASRQLAAVVDRLDALLEQNQRLVHASGTAGVEASSTCSSEGSADGADPKAHLRYWAERLRNGSNGFRGGLSPEQNAALHVLLRRERLLDPQNPWPDLKNPWPDL